MQRKSLLSDEIKVVNIGAELFAEAIKAQGTEVIQVRWRPPAGGNKKTQSMLDRLK